MRQDSAVLNTLRATAVVLVLIDHLCETLAPMHPYDWYLGRLGVLLFFVHTSCVLMLSLRRTPLSGLPLAHHFFVRRAFRIYPLSLLTVLFVVACQVPPVAWGTTPPDSSFRSVAANALLIQDLAGVESVSAPLWSLPLEIQMYLFLPAIFVLIKRGDSLVRASVLWLGGLAVALAAPIVGIRLMEFVPCFMSGVVGFCLSRRVPPMMPFWTWPLALAGLIALYIGLAGLGAEAHPPPAAWLTCLLTGLLLPLFHETSSMARVIPERMAKYSYGIYLSHMITLFVSFRVLGGQPWLLQWLAFLGLTTGISVVAFHAVEAPLIRLGTRVAEMTLKAVGRQPVAIHAHVHPADSPTRPGTYGP